MYPRELYALARDGVVLNRANDEPITNYCVRGERSSGTNFLDALMASGTSLEMTIMGWKHGFYRPTMQNPQLLVMGVIRHWKPWLVSMFRKPWHTSREMHSKTFSEFIREPWESYMVPENTFGLARHKLGHIIYNDRDPVTLGQLPNVMQLRNMKTRNLFGIFNLNCNFILMKYEWLNDDPSRLSTMLRDQFGIEVETDFSPIENRFADVYDMFSAFRPEGTDSFRAEDIAEHDLDFIRDQLDPRLETMLGYDLT